MFDWDWIMEQNPSIGELMAITNSALIEWTNRSLCAHGYNVNLQPLVPYNTTIFMR